MGKGWTRKGGQLTGHGHVKPVPLKNDVLHLQGAEGDAKVRRAARASRPATTTAMVRVLQRDRYEPAGRRRRVRRVDATAGRGRRGHEHGIPGGHIPPAAAQVHRLAGRRLITVSVTAEALLLGRVYPPAWSSWPSSVHRQIAAHWK